MKNGLTLELNLSLLLRSARQSQMSIDVSGLLWRYSLVCEFQRDRVAACVSVKV